VSRAVQIARGLLVYVMVAVETGCSHPQSAAEHGRVGFRQFVQTNTMSPLHGAVMSEPVRTNGPASMQEIQKAFTEGRYEQCISLCHTHEGLWQEGEVTSLHIIVDCYVAQGRRDDALELLKEIAMFFPKEKEEVSRTAIRIWEHRRKFRQIDYWTPQEIDRWEKATGAKFPSGTPRPTGTFLEDKPTAAP